MIRRAVAAAILAPALWLSGAVLAPAGTGGGWLAALPPWPAFGAACAAAALLVAWRAPSTLLALLPLIAVLLPWAPGLDAGLIYAGPLMVPVWAAVLVLGWGDGAAARVRAAGWAATPRGATIAAFLIALAWTSIIAWRVAPMIPGGDEPHYLIITQSLMTDGDLRIENNHERRDFAAYAAGNLNPQYLVRGRDGAIYPIHAPGLPALAIPAFAAAGYPGVVVFLIVVMALASALLWRIAWLATNDIGSAWFGWAMVTASCTWAFQSFLVFPDGLGAAAVACGLWLVLRLDSRAAPPPIAIAGAGLVLALLPWLHTRFAVLAGGLGLMILARLYRHGPRAMALFLAAPVLGAAAWFGFFQAIYGTPSPIAPWGGTGGSRLAWIPSGLSGMLFDQQFGLLPYAPVLAAGVAGLATGTAAGWRRATRMQVALLLAASYIAASASYAMWWGGLSVPARLMTVLLPLLAPAGAVMWQRARNPVVRAGLAAALGWTIFATASLAFAGRGLFAWNVRQHKAGLWFEWAAPLVRWTDALPAFFRADDLLGRESLPLPIFHGLTLLWMALLAAAVGVSLIAVRLVQRRNPRIASRVAAPAVLVTALVLALPAATLIALRLQGTDGSSTPVAQTALLARLARGGGIVVDLGARRTLAAADAVRTMQVRVPAGAGATRSVGPLPAGRYRLSAEPGGPPGNVSIGRGAPVASVADGPVDLILPVGVNAITVHGAQGRTLVLEPAALLPRRSRQPARRAMRYGAVTAFFIDDRAYAEQRAFWVGGARFANVVLQADPGITRAQLELVNGPVPNYVSVIGAAAPLSRALMPREAVPVAVLFDDQGAARLQIESRAGFIPARIDANSRDQRFLGVYVRIKH